MCLLDACSLLLSVPWFSGEFGLKSTSQCETWELLRSAGHSPGDEPCKACRIAVKISSLLLPQAVQRSDGGGVLSLLCFTAIVNDFVEAR